MLSFLYLKSGCHILYSPAHMWICFHCSAELVSHHKVPDTQPGLEDTGHNGGRMTVTFSLAGSLDNGNAPSLFAISCLCSPYSCPNFHPECLPKASFGALGERGPLKGGCVYLYMILSSQGHGAVLLKEIAQNFLVLSLLPGHEMNSFPSPGSQL